MANRLRHYRNTYGGTAIAPRDEIFEARPVITSFETCNVSPGTSDNGSTVSHASAIRPRTTLAFHPRATYKESLPADASEGEKMCDAILEECLDRECKRFYNYRDPRISNADTKRALEFDIYVPSLFLAIEYNGRQHYGDVAHFGNNSRAQISRDHQKRVLAADLGIRLVTIPYTYTKEVTRAVIQNAVRASRSA